MSGKKSKKKAKNAFPKRIAGVKVPKRLRRFASTPIGSAIIVESFVVGARALSKSNAVRQTARDVGQEAEHLGAIGANFVADLLRTALMPVYHAAHEIAHHQRGDAPPALGGKRSSANGAGLENGDLRDGSARRVRTGPFAPNAHP